MLANRLISTSYYISYIVHKGIYLIPQRPKRGMSSYILFTKDFRKQLKAQKRDISDITEVSKLAGEKWKSMTPEEKKVYEDKAKALGEENSKVKDEYAEKYTIPFKTYSVHKLVQEKVKEQLKDYEGEKNLKMFGQKVKQFKQKLTEEQKKELEEEARKRNERNQQLIEPFKIPTLKHPTFNGYLAHLRNQAKAKGEKIPPKTELSEQVLKQYESQHHKIVEDYHQKLKQFAESHKMTIDDLAKLVRKEERQSERVTIKAKGIAESSTKGIQKDIRKNYSAKIKDLREERDKEIRETLKKAGLTKRKKKGSSKDKKGKAKN